MDKTKIGIILKKIRGAITEMEIPSVSQICHTTRDPFRILIGTMLSLRTKDAVTIEASARLFKAAHTPKTLLKLTPEQIEKLIFPVGFYKNKARQILKTCAILIEEHGGAVPNDQSALMALPGVGLKTANLVLALGFKTPAICVDTHVHRISNRLGYVKTKTPEETEKALREILPKRYWIEYNDLLVTYGQNICTPQSPWCSRCSVERHCDKVNVTRSR